MSALADTLFPNDSLRRAVEQMFLHGAQFGPAESALSVQHAPAAATAADLYGSGSFLAHSLPAVSGTGSAPETAIQIYLLMLGAVYALLLSNHLGNVYTLFAHSASGSAAGRRTRDIRGGSNYTPFLNLSVIVGLLFSGILCLRITAPQSLATGIPQLLLCLAATVVFTAVLFVQTGMMKLAGAITLTQEFMTELNGVKRSSLALYSILFPPVLLCYALTPAGSGEGWIFVLLAETSIVLFLFLKESLALFAAKKVSIFHWFLYLCTVELFPFSLLWLLIARH